MALLYTLEKKYLPLIQKYRTIISSVSDPTVNVEALVLAHMKQESNFNPKAYRGEPAINDASRGLLQILLSTARQFENVTADDLYDPETNIRIAMKYMALNISDYPGNLDDAIAAYNSGSVYQNDQGQYTNSQGDTNVQNYVDHVIGNYFDYISWLAQNAPIVNPVAVDAGGVLAFGIAAFLGWKYVR